MKSWEPYQKEHENLSVVRLEGRVVSLNSEEARKVGDHRGNLTIVKLKRRRTRLGELDSVCLVNLIKSHELYDDINV